MITQECVKLIAWSINTASLLCLNSLHFNIKKQKIYFQKYWLKELARVGADICQLGFILAGLIVLFSNYPFTEVETSFLLYYINGVIASFLAAPIILLLRRKESDLKAWMNGTLRYFKNFEETYTTQYYPKHIHRYETLMQIYRAGSFPQPLICQIFFYILAFQNPRRSEFTVKPITLVFPSITQVWLTDLIMLTGLFICIEVTLLLGQVLQILFFVLMYNGVHNFIMGEIRPNTNSIFTIPKLRLPAHALFTYKCLQISSGSALELLSPFFIPSTNVIALSLNVLVNWLTIKLNTKLGIGLLMSLFVSIGTMTYQLLVFKQFGQYYETSIKFKNTWGMTRNFEYTNINRRTTKILSRYIRSLQPMKIMIGDFNYYSKVSCVEAFGRVVYFTGKLLLMTK